MEIYLKTLKRTILQSQLFKVTNKGKLSRMFSLAYNFPTTRQIHRNFVEKSTCKQSGLLDNKITSKKESTPWISWQKKLHRKKYVETRWIFQPSKLNRKKYVETTWIFRSAKLHRKSKWNQRGNSSKFGLRRIDVISTSNQRVPVGFRFVLIRHICKVYIIDTCAAKTHSHS